ncbi:MAG: UDP-N-acetylmuramoylalanyl-D-glutamyl-2,6-diaminopimelate--D-alanyl-D-alanine ligase [Hyphomicrobiales bacterium]|nr:UDP-N-acetylmuramoylalanyl-D-glutamyl-2,6-diaminopimelate--D-alanyl-D-alanine ligase [Hyphomicrobiales bacterium]
MTDPLWTFEAAVAAMQGEVAGAPPEGLTEVSIDSRTLAPGALFVAIRGERLDGHDYVAAAFEAGAGAAVVARDAALDGVAGPLIRVDDTLEALNALGRAARGRTEATVIAVTGSVGKTGTKEGLRLALAPSGITHASDKSYNNHWGVPLSLSNMASGTQFGVFEAGMNSAGEITPLSRMIRPHVAIVTTVEAVHIEFFDSVEQIAEAKAEIFLGLEPDGTAILNKDNAYFDLLARRAREAGAGRILAFGVDPSADARLEDVTLGPEGSDVTARIDGATVRYRVGAAGRHLAMNSLAVLAAVQAAGGDLAAGAAALSAYAAPKGRGERLLIRLGDGTVNLIDESYNANPASVRAALAAMAQTPRAAFPRRVAVLGDMLELGETGVEEHLALADPVDAAGIDVVFACGPQMASLYDALPKERRGAHAPSAAELEAPLLAAVRAGDVVMVKGSLGSRMGPLVEALKEHLSEQGSD